MAYAAITDLLERYTEAQLMEITTPAGQDWGVLDQTRIQTALDDASDEMDGYLRKRYQTPVAVVPAKMVAVCCQIAIWNLCQIPNVITSEKITNGHKDALSWLRRVSDGSIVLEGELVDNQSTDWAQYQGRPPMGFVPGSGRFG